MMEDAYGSFFPEYKDVVTVDDLCDMLSIGKLKAYDLVKSGRVKSVKIGKIYRIPKRAVYQYLYPTE